MAENSKIETHPNQEFWETITEFPKYEVSNYGRVRNRGSGHLLAGSVGKYRFVRLPTKSRWVKKYIHRLVAAAFVPQIALTCTHVNHKDGNKLNNFFANLEWVTQRANNRHAYRKDLIPSGEKHHWAILTQAQVDEIRTKRGIEKQRVLAERFGVKQATISAIQLGKCWNTQRRCE